jgi:hypothetical protein
VNVIIKKKKSFSSQKATPSSESRIINGERAANTPFHVHILYLNNAVPPAGFFGGGVLISNQHVLTVATNIVGFSQWRLSFGSTTHAAAETQTSTLAIAHPSFIVTGRMYDIGVITIPVRILFTRKVVQFFNELLCVDLTVKESFRKKSEPFSNLIIINNH